MRYLIDYLLVVNGEEYCEYETFSPSCANSEVILITEAIYGRMKTGKCIPDKYYEDLGCSANVQTALSQHCSGRQSCSYRINNLVIDYQGNCPPSATRSYLEVSFTCLRGDIFQKFALTALFNFILNNYASFC